VAKRTGPARRRQFTREFKLEAVRLVTDGGRAPSVVARELGIHANMLRTWRRRLVDAAAAPAPGTGTVTSQDEEIRRRRREVARLTQARDFLRSATVYFAKESR
jgi:transposase